MIYNADSLKKWNVSALINGRYVLARPLSGTFRWRVKAALGVLTGKYDALQWTEQP